jgi:HEAT repeat protein
MRQRAGEQPVEPLAVVLGWIGAGALAPLLSLLDQPGVAAPIGDALVAIGAPAVDPLIARLRHEERDVRLTATTLLGRLGDRRAVRALIEVLRNADIKL